MPKFSASCLAFVSRLLRVIEKNASKHVNAHLLLISILLQVSASDTFFWLRSNYKMVELLWCHRVCCSLHETAPFSCVRRRDVNSRRMLLVSHSQLVCFIAYGHRGLSSWQPPPHNNGYVMSWSRQWANDNDIQIGNYTRLILSYCFIVNVSSTWQKGPCHQCVFDWVIARWQSCFIMYGVNKLLKNNWFQQYDKRETILLHVSWLSKGFLWECSDCRWGSRQHQS